MLPVQIAGLGWYLPAQRVSTTMLAARFGIDATTIERTTGVRERRVAQGETSASMGASAARMALQQAGVVGSEVDAIIGASSTPQQAIPCTAALLQRELQLPEGRAVGFDLNATCLSFMLALQTAAQAIATGTYRTVLVVSSEIPSVALHPAQWQSSALFGDAAAAAVITRASRPDQGLVGTRSATYSSGATLTQLLGGGTLHHPNQPTTTAEMNVFMMDGPGVFRQAVRLFRPFLAEFMASIGWEREDVDLVVPHQASRHAVEQLSGRFGFRPEQVFSNLRLRGNCVAASLPLALAEAQAAGRIQPGMRVLLLGTGAGLTLGAQALIW